MSSVVPLHAVGAPLLWKETARRFRTSWDSVLRAVEHAVRWRLEHRSLDDIAAIDVDELAWKKGHKSLTLVYQLDHGRRRLLHISRHRTAQSFHAFFDLLGEQRSRSIQFVASDMWFAFINVVRARCGSAVHVLDRFHVMALLSKAIDETRRAEVRGLHVQGKSAALTKTRWVLLKRKRNLTGKQRVRLRELLTWNLRTVRAYLLKEDFQHFWTYTTVWAGHRFLASRTREALRTRIEPINKSARTLRAHEPELLNWFRARGQFAAGATEGLNNKARIFPGLCFTLSITRLFGSECTLAGLAITPLSCAPRSGWSRTFERPRSSLFEDRALESICEPANRHHERAAR